MFIEYFYTKASTAVWFNCQWVHIDWLKKESSQEAEGIRAVSHHVVYKQKY